MNIVKSVPYLLQMPSNRTSLDYDEEADVLYISFKKPQRATDSKMEDNIVYHYRNEELVWITVIGAKKYSHVPE